MKRRIFIAAIFVLAGAVVNVAVAWIFAFVDRPLSRPDADLTTRLTRIAYSDVICVHEIRAHGTLRVLCYRFADTSNDATSSLEQLLPVPLIASPLDLQPDTFVLHRAYGWPLLSLAHMPGAKSSLNVRPTRLLINRSSTPPLRPLWPGFALNTLFYATVLGLLIPGPFALRRFIRRRRGLCTKCAYPMGESDVCTECGTALPGRTEAMT